MGTAARYGLRATMRNFLNQGPLPSNSPPASFSDMLPSRSRRPYSPAATRRSRASVRTSSG